MTTRKATATADPLRGDSKKGNDNGKSKGNSRSLRDDNEKATKQQQWQRQQQISPLRRQNAPPSVEMTGFGAERCGKQRRLQPQVLRLRGIQVL
jgi:hypothetical protein